MFGQIMIPVERLAAEFAAEWLVSGVKALVVLKVGRGGVALATLVTRKHFTVCCTNNEMVNPSQCCV